MCFQIFGHLFSGLEQIGENLVIGRDDWILCVHAIKRNGAAIGIYYGLHRIAHIVKRRRTSTRGIWIHIGRRIGIYNPVELALRQDHIGVGIVAKKWSYGLHALANLTPQHNAALGGDIIAQYEV